MENRSSNQVEARDSGLADRGLALTILAFWACVSFVSFVPSSFAQPAERARTEGLARRAAERLQSLQREADRLAAQERTIIGDLRKLEIERQVKGQELKQVDRDASKLEAELATITERMGALQQSEREARPQLTASLVEMYKPGPA